MDVTLRAVTVYFKQEFIFGKIMDPQTPPLLQLGCFYYEFSLSCTAWACDN